MAERLDLQQAEAVAAYLSREIIDRGATQKLVRLGYKIAIGPEQYHTNVAKAAGLKIIGAVNKIDLFKNEEKDRLPKIIRDVAEILEEMPNGTEATITLVNPGPVPLDGYLWRHLLLKDGTECWSAQKRESGGTEWLVPVG